MMTNAEIREEAWGVVRGRWFWRIFMAGGTLYFIFLIVTVAITQYYSGGNIQTWTDFLQAKAEAMQSGLGYTVPSSRVFWQMTGASAFQQFISCVFGSILLFGMAGLMLKAVRNEDKGWFGGAFGGFKRPLELTWLMVLLNLRVFLWSLLFVIPGIVAMYRYRQAWYLKSEHPDWSASKCLAESAEMMRGFKGQACSLDVFFSFCWVLPSALALGVVGVGLTAVGQGSTVVRLIVSIGSLVCTYFFIFVLAYFFVARAVFYKALSCVRTCA